MMPAPVLCAACAALALLAGCAGSQRVEPTPQDQMSPDQRRAEAHRLVMTAQEQSRAGAEREAIETYKQSVLLYGGDAFAWYNLGVLLKRQGRLAESSEAWRMAADADPTDPRALTALGLQLQELGWLSDAAEHYRRALERDPSYLPALKKAVEVDQLSDRYTDTTLENVRRALLQEQDPQWVEFLRRVQGKALERVGRAGGNTGG